MTSSYDEFEEEFIDDPIKLIDYEQIRVSYSDQQAWGINYLNSTSSNDIENSNNIFGGLCTNRECKNLLMVKLVDCRKFPWYFKRDTQQIINKISHVDREMSSDTETMINVENCSDDDDDCVMLDAPDMGVHNRCDCQENMPQVLNTEANKRFLFLQKIKVREDIAIQKALSQKNKANIDFKRNKGLIGLTIKPKVTINLASNIVNDEENKNVNHKDSEMKSFLNAADKVLNVCGTDLIEVIQDSETLPKMKENTNIAIKNTDSLNMPKATADPSQNARKVPVRFSIETISKQLLEDIKKKKMYNSMQQSNKYKCEPKNNNSLTKKSGHVSKKDSKIKLNKKPKSNSSATYSKIKPVKEKLTKDTNKKIENKHQKESAQPSIPSKSVTVKQNSKDISQISLANDRKASPKPKDIEKLSNSPQHSKETEDGLKSPILCCNSLSQKQKNVPFKVKSMSLMQSEKISHKGLSQLERLNKIVQNIRSQNNNKSQKDIDVKITDDLTPNVKSVKQNENGVSCNQNKGTSKVHFYSLSYLESKSPVDTKTNKRVRSQEPNTNAVASEYVPPPLTQSNQRINSMQILSVRKINEENMSSNRLNTSSSDDKAHKFSLQFDVSQPQSQHLIENSPRDTKQKQNLSALDKNLEPHNQYILHNNKTPSTFLDSRTSALIIRPRFQGNLNPRLGHPIPTQISPTPMLYKSNEPNRGVSQRFVRPSTLYRYPLQSHSLHYDKSKPLLFNQDYNPSRRYSTDVNPASTMQTSLDLCPERNESNHYASNLAMQWYYPKSFLLPPPPPPPPPPPLPSELSKPTVLNYLTNPTRNERCLDNKGNTFSPVITNVTSHVKDAADNYTQHKDLVTLEIKELEIVESKRKMQEELDRVIIEEDIDNNLKRPHDIVNIKENETSLNTEPVPKRVKINETKSRPNQQRYKNFRNETNLTRVLTGYSPPILPIPGTYVEVLKEAKSEVKDVELGKNKKIPNTFERIRNEKNSNKKLISKPYGQCDFTLFINKEAKKISLDEYKKRISRNDNTGCASHEKAHKKCKHSGSSINKRNLSMESDHGYDSDTTVVI